MIKRVVAALMIVVGALALTPLVNIALELMRYPQVDAENVMFVLLCAVPAVGTSLIVSGIWLYSTTKGAET